MEHIVTELDGGNASGRIMAEEEKNGQKVTVDARENDSSVHLIEEKKALVNDESNDYLTGGEKKVLNQDPSDITLVTDANLRGGMNRHESMNLKQSINVLSNRESYNASATDYHNNVESNIRRLNDYANDQPVFVEDSEEANN